MTKINYLVGERHCEGCGCTFTTTYNVAIDSAIWYGDQCDYFCAECWPKIKPANEEFLKAWTVIAEAIHALQKENGYEPTGN